MMIGTRGVLENFCSRIDLIGFETSKDEIQFSDFYSQGDGASFEGTVNILTYLKKTKQLTVNRTLVRAINCGYIEEAVSITRDSHHYSHENTCSLCNIEVYEDITSKVSELLSDLDGELEEKRKEFSLELYRDLEKSNNYLCSDKSIIETLIANEYEFSINGTMI